MGNRIAATFLIFAFASPAFAQSEPCEDLDQDGYLAGPGCVVQEDCNDQNSSIHPLAPELCDGWDNDCDWELDEGCSRTCPDFGIARRVVLSLDSGVEGLLTIDRGWAVMVNPREDNSPTLIACLDNRGERITPWRLVGSNYLSTHQLVWSGSEIAAAWSRNNDYEHGIWFRRLGRWGKAPMDEYKLEPWRLGANKLGWNGYEYFLHWSGRSTLYDGTRFARFNTSGILEAPYNNTVSSTYGGDIAWNGSGYGWAYTHEIAGTNELMFRKLDEQGFTSGEPIQLTDHTSPNPPGSAGGGTYHIRYLGHGSGYAISWMDNATGNWEVWFLRLDDSGQLMTPPGPVQVTHINRQYGVQSPFGMEWSGEEFLIVWNLNDIYAAPGHLIGTRVSTDGVLLEEVDLTEGPWDRNPRVAWNGRSFGIHFSHPGDAGPGNPDAEFLIIGCNCSTDGDSDGVLPCAGGDCDDSDPDVGAGMNEICDDGKDNDCDGLVDCNDPDCGQGGKDPGLIGGVGFSDKDTLYWNTDSNSDDYDIVRGAISDLKDMENYLWSDCFRSRIPGTTVSDTDTASSGTGWYYQVRGHARTCLIGPWGTVLRDDTIRSCP